MFFLSCQGLTHLLLHFQACNGFYDSCTLRAIGKGGCEALELGNGLFPGEWPGMKALVIALLAVQCMTVFEGDLDAAGHLGGKTFAQRFIWLDGDLAQQALYVLPCDTLRR